MSPTGTASYLSSGPLPAGVQAAVEVAQRMDFAYSCRREQGELLRVLAGGVGAGLIGETGTGCGVGLAWLASGARPGARLISVERDADRARAAAELFAGQAAVQVRAGDWSDIEGFGPYDLLVLDGGGQGKGVEPPLDPTRWLRPGGVVVIDDFTPWTGWPPVFEGRPDTAARYWLEHPHLRATVVKLAPDLATIIGTYLGRSEGGDPPA